MSEDNVSLEEMCSFFERRLGGYDEHMMSNIMSAKEFYSFTAKLLPVISGCRILDLGCGTGLELGDYYFLCPSAKVTAIDLSQKMLSVFKKKFCNKDISLIVGSYFDVPFGDNIFDAAVSVESLHHFTKKEKVPLYFKLRKSLKKNSYFILTDFFSLSDNEEKERYNDFLELKKKLKITDDKIYHYDIPLTVEHEKEALFEARFKSVEVLNQWGNTFTIKAVA